MLLTLNDTNIMGDGSPAQVYWEFNTLKPRGNDAWFSLGEWPKVPAADRGDIPLRYRRYPLEYFLAGCDGYWSGRNSGSGHLAGYSQAKWVPLTIVETGWSGESE